MTGSSAEHPDPPSVSVIIPVFNDRRRLKLCLASLGSQDYLGVVQTIVVDNGSTDELESLRTEFDQVDWLGEPEPGSYAARNTGLAAATGEIVAFTDSDCIPVEDWITRGVECLQSEPFTTMVGGVVEVFVEDGALTGLAIHEMRHAFPQERYIVDHNFSVTANAFVRHDALRQVGGFDSSLRSGGDRELGRQLTEAGHELRFCPGARVAHPARTSWRSVAAKAVRTRAGERDTFGQPGWRVFVADLAKAAMPPGRSLLRALTDKSLPTHGQRLRYAAALVAMRYVAVWSRLATRFRSTSPR